LNRRRKNPFDALIGLKLSILRRAADMLVVHFGEVHKVKNGSVGDYALHIQCPWRLDGPKGTLTGRYDLFEYAGPGREPKDWSYEDGFSLQDIVFDKLTGGYDASTGSWFNDRNRFIVGATSLSRQGDVRIDLSHNHTLLLFPDRTAYEAWRFFKPGDRRDHLVFPYKR
jgi:hypothetical protein